MVDVLRTQSEHLALAESAAQTDYDGDPVPLVDGIADPQCRSHRPRVAPLPRRLGPPHRFCVHGVARNALVVDGRFQDGGKLGQDAALVVDRRDCRLQVGYERTQIRCGDTPERKLAQVRDDMETRSTLLTVLGFRSTSSTWRPVRRDIVGQRDGPIARVYKLASLLVCGCTAKPSLGVLQHIKGSVSHARYTSDLVPLALTVASGFLPSPSDRVLLLFEPTILDVAGQTGFLSS